MPPEMLQVELPAFYRLGTLADMSRMAAKIALARKAIGEIRKIENYLEAHKNETMESGFDIAMKETRDYALIVAGAMRDAVMILKKVRASVESYREDVHDASH